MSIWSFVLTVTVFVMSLISTTLAAYCNQSGHYFFGTAWGIEAVIMGGLAAKLIITLIDCYMPDTDDRIQH